MKSIYSILPAVVFSAVITLFIAQENQHPSVPSKGNTVAASDLGEEESAADYAQYELQRLHDPQTGKIPVNIRQLELEYASTLPGYSSSATKESASLSGIPYLKSRGPWNVGGRTRAFAIDVSNTSKLLAGSTSGGMWTSTNGGASWSPNWGILHQSVSCIAQDTRSGKTNTWYIGTGEGYGQSAGASGAYYLGNGMYKSTDGGTTWVSLPSTTNTPNTPQTFENVWDLIWNVAINPADAVNDVVYAASYGAIFKSTNGGTTWSTVRGSTGTSPFSYFSDVAVTPSGVVYATLSSEGTQKGIWRSANGTNWQNITPGGFPTTYGRVKIGVSPSNEEQVYFFAGTTTGFGTPDTNFQGAVEWNSLWKYDSIGGKWFDLSANMPTTGGLFDKQAVQGGYDMVIKVHPTDTSVVFLGGTNLYRSNNGFFSPSSTTFIGGYEQGATLPVVNMYLNHHPDQHELAFVPGSPNEMYCTNDGGIYKTSNNLSSTVAWTSLNNGYLNSMFYTVAIDHASSSANDSTLIGGAQDNGSWFVNSNNSQTNWVTPRGGDGSYCAISNNKSNYYFSIQNGKVMKATLNTAGTVQTFARIDPIGGKGYQFINPFILDPNNNNIMYLAGGKNLWRNDDLSTIPMVGNWDSISTSWTKFPDTVPTTNAKITALAVSKNPANILYYGTSNKKVYRVDNANTGTSTALDISGSTFPNGANVSSIAVDPTDAGNVMVSFSNYNVYSIFYSTNADSTIPTWTKVAGNLEQNSNTGGTGNGPSVRWVSIMPVADGTAYLAATSTGLYGTSSLTGTIVWTQLGASTIGNSICDMIDYRSADGLVAVATHSHGIYTTNITSITDVLGVHNLANVQAMNLSNYPNPFSSSTTINFTLNERSKVNLTILDLNGRLVKTLLNQELPEGNHRAELTDQSLSQGIYYCRLKAGEIYETKKIVLIK